MGSSLDLLEFPALVAILDRYARTPGGHREIRASAPGQPQGWLDRTYRLAGEAARYLRDVDSARRGVLRLDFSGLEDVEPLLAHLRIEGTALEATEISAVLLLLDRASDLRQLLDGLGHEYPALRETAGRSSDFSPLLREFSGRILPDGSLDDRASPVLHRIRQELGRKRAAIEESLERVLREHSQGEGALQDEIVTIRNDRFVVPVKTGMKRRIEGVVHGSSSSGQTVFIEPLETIERNNELIALREDEAREIHRILREMTARLRERAEEIAVALAAVTELDAAFARGAFAKAFDCVMPVVNADRLVLKNARHPVLQDVLRGRGGKVIPMSLELDRENRVLVISGPNTGGKTIALKTAGLLALAAQAGIPVPASEAAVPIFDQVLADIGDHQSIAESLSTFSAHMTNIAAMSGHVTPGSLVLLDEIGTGTDPQEGGALAVALVEHFLRAGAFVIASTHHLALKAYAMNTPGVLNAAVGFDEQTLAPTYRLLMGVPGKSSGLDIAGRLGVPTPILERARAALASQDAEVARLLSRLQDGVEETDRLRAELSRHERELREQTARLSAEWSEKEKKRLAGLERALDIVISRLDEEARTAMKDIADRATRKEMEKRVAAARSEMREEFSTAVVEQLGTAPAPARRPEPAEIVPGMNVRVRALGRAGVVKRKIADDLFEVEVGALKTRVSAREMEALAPSAPARASVQVTASVPTGLSSEINVIGCTAEEALERVDKFLDSAVLGAVARVRVVHGHGKGILRKALGELFADHPLVEKSYAAPQNEGGTGATIVELRV
jgi:DNA mismatch repair protein MutS2